MSVVDCIRLIDHTSLGDADTEQKISELVKEATSTVVENGGSVTTAAICIWPAFVKFAKSITDLTVATVVNFPKGEKDINAVVEETSNACIDGADEIDLVINYKLFHEDVERASEEVISLCKAVKAACGARPLKVILETGELRTPELINAASVAALQGGADTLKTSTGKVPVNATPEAARVMLEAIAAHKPTAGFKAAGGVKSYDDAKIYLNLFESITGRVPTKNNFRFGASSLLAVLAKDLPNQTHIESNSSSGY